MIVSLFYMVNKIVSTTSSTALPICIYLVYLFMAIYNCADTVEIKGRAGEENKFMEVFHSIKIGI